MTVSDDLQATLGSAYTLERELGGGGMSRVFVAEEVALGRKVAVKVLMPELAAGVSAERFQREIKLAAQLQHPNIVPVLVTGIAAGLPYYTMPFVDGLSLRARLDRNPAMPIAEAVPILKDMARALAYAHDHGVVHRDIKPENVLLADEAVLVSRCATLADTTKRSRLRSGRRSWIPPSSGRSTTWQELSINQGRPTRQLPF